MLLEALPASLRQEVAEANEASRQAAAAGQWERVVELQEGVYRAMLEAQSEGRRIHKGGPLMSIGSALLAGGDPDQALDWVLQAFVEDVLSRAEENPDSIDELSRPAAMTLLFNFGLRGPALVDLAVRLRRRVADHVLWRRPDEALRDEPFAVPRAETVARQSGQAQAAIQQVAGSASRIAPWRLPGLFGTHHEDRVFVGGSYGKEFLGSLLIIRDTLRAEGLDGVLAAEFKRPGRTAETNYDDALLLLRSCRWAVFDVSERSGQLHEVQDAVSLGMGGQVLMLRSSASSRPSDMTTGAARKLGTKIRTYVGPAELQMLVRRWASRRRRSARIAGERGTSST